ncbi:MAG: asparaginase [Acidobacteria bacterium]|nr:asparaginase [Acidobacteriota bacterium]
MEEAAVLVEVTRGATVESRHRGMIAAVTSVGGVAARAGDIHFVTFLRSSAKPLQAIPLVASGAAEHFGITNRELAVIIGSHNGQDIHTEAVSGVLAKIGLDGSALKCGVHMPYDTETAKQLGPNGATVLHNNCSGKHTGMLAASRFLGYELSSYDHPDHPLQQQILATIAKFAEVGPMAIALGQDGCGVPSFAVSVYRMALIYARLVCPNEAEWDVPTLNACARVVRAMIEVPEMVGATRNRFDSDLMRVAKGRLIAKVGAEGVYTVGVLPSEKYPLGLGVAAKIEDGDDRRVRAMVVAEALRQLEVLSEDDLAQLASWHQRTLKNHRGDIVGAIRPAFHLEMSPQL